MIAFGFMFITNVTFAYQEDNQNLEIEALQEQEMQIREEINQVLNNLEQDIIRCREEQKPGCDRLEEIYQETKQQMW